MSDTALSQQSKPQPPMVVLRNFLDARVHELQTALPPHMSAERFIRVVLTAVQLNPDLLACDRSSLWNAAMRCAQDGLLPDGREAALVAFKAKAQYLPMYAGLLKKFRNSWQFKWVTAGIVYEGEEYHHWIDETGEHFRHVPGDDVDSKKIRRVYALATTLDGGSFIADMPLSDVEKRRAQSRASREDAPWGKWPQEMMKKTAIRVLSKLLPMSSDIDALIRRDEDALLGVDAVDDTRAALAARPTTQATLDQFGGDKPATDLQSAIVPLDEPNATDSATGTEAEHPPSEPADDEAVGAPLHKPSAPAAESSSKPTTFEGYMTMVRDKVVHATDPDQLRAWFVSDQQRQLRNKIGVVAEQRKEAQEIIDARVKELSAA
jgi:recombination protein RecT